MLARNAAGGQQAAIEQAIGKGCRGIVSFGIAGGLAPGLAPGAWIVGSAVINRAGESFPTCPDWSARLLRSLPGAHHSAIIGSDAAVAHPAVKRMLHKQTGAAAVDMESHFVAELAARHRVPFAALRVVCDPAHRAVPTAAIEGMKEDGTTDPLAVLRGLAMRPSSLFNMMRTAVDFAAARTTLEVARLSLGAGFQLLEDAILQQPAAAALPDLPAAESQPA